MLQALLEQVEIIKTIKADKEDVEEALMTKVDSEYVDHAVETKVSNDELHEACRKISETFDKVRAEFQSQVISLYEFLTKYSTNQQRTNM